MRSMMGMMAERHFSARVQVERSPEATFEWISDYRNAARVLDGLTHWKPLGAETRGRGARFEVGMHALGFPLENVLVIDTWREPDAIGWHSEAGLIRQAGSWHFRRQDGGTEVTLAISYEPPAGHVVAVLAGRVDRVVRRRLADALQRLKEEVEQA
jgi:uncharacterized membrane protein